MIPSPLPLPSETKDLLLVVYREAARELGFALARQMAPGILPMPLVKWGQMLLPAYFRLPPSKMHQWLGRELDQIDPKRGARLNILGPRGGAKSTIGTLTYVLKSAVTEREPYIWIVSDTAGQARTHLAAVKAELESNRELAAYYPAACGRGRRWRSGAIELRNGVVIEAYGTGQRLRGRRRREHRPTLIVCDDLQNDQHVGSATQRQASREWFHAALLKAGDARTNVVNLATALHRDALAVQLVNSPGWTSTVFKAIECWPERMDLWAAWERIYGDLHTPGAREAAKQFYDAHRDAMHGGAELLWPEREDLYALMRMRFEEGRAAFEREKQNSPVDPERCEWPDEYFGDHLWFREWPAKLAARIIALDPSKGADARFGDYSAFVLLGVDDRGVLYVEADLARRPTPEMVAAGVALCRRFNPDAFGIEANQYQDLLRGEFEAEFQRQHRRVLAPLGVHNHTNKLIRIRRLGPYLSQHRLRFLATSPSTLHLVNQLRDFPQGSHDDGPDALEMAIRLAEAMLSSDANASDDLGGNLIGHDGSR